jgi:hypothetical protein
LFDIELYILYNPKNKATINNNKSLSSIGKPGGHVGHDEGRPYGGVGEEGTSSAKTTPPTNKKKIQ